jgi:2-phospho-L-lactate guanylyltransferase (CobY/MobA/RfbA family)
MIVPIDLPLASISSLSALVNLKEDVVIAPDRKQSGRNVLLLREAAFDKFEFSYGVDSYAAHVACARRNGLSVGILESESLAFDIDEPENDLAWVMEVAE